MLSHGNFSRQRQRHEKSTSLPAKFVKKNPIFSVNQQYKNIVKALSLKGSRKKIQTEKLQLITVIYTTKDLKNQRAIIQLIDIKRKNRFYVSFFI